MAKDIFQRGIDVSRYQGNIDWAQVARSGQQFAIVRAVSSDNSGVYEDPLFVKNANGAKAAGLRTGAYYYTYAQTQAYADIEIAAFLSALSGKQFEYPVFVDVEDDTLKPLGKNRLTDLTLYALQKIEKAGYYAGVYTNTNFAKNNLVMSKLENYPLWLSDYLAVVNYPGPYDMLQYTSDGSVNGISTKVDKDNSYQNFLPQIMAGGWNNYPRTAGEPVMISATGLSVQVFGDKNCQYFNSPNVNDIAGTLPHGIYPAVAQSNGCYNGFSWATLHYRGKIYWTALLADRCYLIKT